MQEMSYRSDLKKVQRKKEELGDELRRHERERSRINVYIKENETESKKFTEKETFIEDELKRIKKKLIELG